MLCLCQRLRPPPRQPRIPARNVELWIGGNFGERVQALDPIDFNRLERAATAEKHIVEIVAFAIVRPQVID